MSRGRGKKLFPELGGGTEGIPRRDKELNEEGRRGSRLGRKK